MENRKYFVHLSDVHKPYKLSRTLSEISKRSTRLQISILYELYGCAIKAKLRRSTVKLILLMVSTDFYLYQALQ